MNSCLILLANNLLEVLPWLLSMLLSMLPWLLEQVAVSATFLFSLSFFIYSHTATATAGYWVCVCSTLICSLTSQGTLPTINETAPSCASMSPRNNPDKAVRFGAGLHTPKKLNVALPNFPLHMKRKDETKAEQNPFSTFNISPDLNSTHSNTKRKDSSNSNGKRKDSTSSTNKRKDSNSSTNKLKDSGDAGQNLKVNHIPVRRKSKDRFDGPPSTPFGIFSQERKKKDKKDKDRFDGPPKTPFGIFSQDRLKNLDRGFGSGSDNDVESLDFARYQ